MRNILYLYSLSTKEKLIFRLFYASAILGIVILFLATLSGPVAVLTVMASVLTGFTGIIMYVYYFPTNTYTKWLLILLIYFLIVGISYGDFNPNFRGGDFIWIVTQDLRYVMYFLIGSIFAHKKYMVYFHKIMQFIGITSIIAAIIGLAIFNLDISSISNRDSTWSISYFLWWISAACFAYWGYYGIIIKKEKLLSFGVLLSYFILGVLFLKRSAFINVIVVAFIGNNLANRNVFKSTFRIILLVLSVVMFFIVLRVLLNSESLDTLFNLLFNRFSEIENIEDVDRIKEWNTYYNSASVRQLLLGNGIGHYPSLKVIENFVLEKVNALHVGFYNILFKGGIIYVTFYILIYIKVFQRTFRIQSLSRYELVCLGVALSAFISLFYEGSWGYTLIPFCISAPIFYIAQSKN